MRHLTDTVNFSTSLPFSLDERMFAVYSCLPSFVLFVKAYGLDLVNKSSANNEIFDSGKNILIHLMYST